MSSRFRPVGAGGTRSSATGSEGGAQRFHPLPRHDNLCHPASRVFKGYQGATGHIFSINIGPNCAGKIRNIDVKTLKQVGEMMRAARSAQGER